MGKKTQKSFYVASGVINDPDGYTNVREGKGTNFPVKWKYTKKDVFNVYPNYEESWWEVQDFLNCEKGYINRSKVMLFGHLPQKMRDSLKDTLISISGTYHCN